jgi:hypothetical protein
MGLIFFLIIIEIFFWFFFGFDSWGFLFGLVLGVSHELALSVSLGLQLGTRALQTVGGRCKHPLGCHVSRGIIPGTFGSAECERFWTAPEGLQSPLLPCLPFLQHARDIPVQLAMSLL